MQTDSTELSKCFARQGARIHIRSDTRFVSADPNGRNRHLTLLGGEEGGFRTANSSLNGKASSSNESGEAHTAAASMHGNDLAGAGGDKTNTSMVGQSCKVGRFDLADNQPKQDVASVVEQLDGEVDVDESPQPRGRGRISPLPPAMAGTKHAASSSPSPSPSNRGRAKGGKKRSKKGGHVSQSEQSVMSVEASI